MNTDILHKFTTHVRNTLSRSIDIAWELQAESIPPLFLLCGLAEQEDSIGQHILKKNKISSAAISHFMQQKGSSVVAVAEKSRGRGERAGGTHKGVGEEAIKEPKRPAIFLWPEFSKETKGVIEAAAITAFEMRHHYIGTEHLLLALLQSNDADIDQLLKDTHTSPSALHKEIESILREVSSLQTPVRNAQHTENAQRTDGTSTHTHAENATDGIQHALVMESENDGAAASTSDTPALDYFGSDLTAEEEMNKIDPVIGRQQEIDRMVHILSRRTKNNPVLIGDPGVGKTAIVEGLAKRVALGQVPNVLLNKRIIALDITSVLAGTMYRGEFESRLKQLLEELKRHPDIILFIDEMHTIVGAGGVQGGTVDAANMLKPALAKGYIRCIGATTADEYRKHIEHDPALERRFQPIVVKEPSAEEAVEIVRGVKQYYEQFHHVIMSDDVLRAAVELSVRYMPEKRLPDKAIDLLDEVGAKIRSGIAVPQPLRLLETYTRTLRTIRQKKEDAARNERFHLAVELKKKEQTLLKKIEDISALVSELQIPYYPIAVTDVVDVVARTTGIPHEHLLANSTQRYERLEDQIRTRIVGQDAAVHAVVSAIKRSYAGLASPHRPLGSFMFLGPSGVGKTQLAKVLAETVFGDAGALLRVDMSEFSEGFHLAKLLGAPAGYVGYNDSVKFVEHIRRKPFSVVLFDEIEKAHPDIFNVLLQVLDEGRLTDSNGRVLNFRNTIIILTSNIGLDALNKQAALGFEMHEQSAGDAFDETAQSIIEELKSLLPPEFLNRIDYQLVFRPLNADAIEKIVALECAVVQERVATQQMTVQIPAGVKKFLATQSIKPDQGARLVRKTIAELLENPLADALLAGACGAGDLIRASVKKGKIIFTTQKKKK